MACSSVSNPGRSAPVVAEQNFSLIRLCLGGERPYEPSGGNEARNKRYREKGPLGWSVVTDDFCNGNYGREATQRQRYPLVKAPDFGAQPRVRLEGDFATFVRIGSPVYVRMPKSQHQKAEAEHNDDCLTPTG